MITSTIKIGDHEITLIESDAVREGRALMVSPGGLRRPEEVPSGVLTVPLGDDKVWDSRHAVILRCDRPDFPEVGRS